jgi:hypothetical protein
MTLIVKARMKKKQRKTRRKKLKMRKMRTELPNPRSRHS